MSGRPIKRTLRDVQGFDEEGVAVGDDLVER